MKYISFLSIFFVVSIESFSQTNTPAMPIDNSTGLITYSEVIVFDTLIDKNDLFSRGREWFAKSYKSSKSVIEMEDKESGKIVGKAVMQVYHKALGKNHRSGYINYTIAIYFKDGKYKYEISNFHHTGQYVGDGYTIPDYGACEEMINTKKKTMGISYQKTFDYYLLQIDSNVKSLVDGLKDAMNIKASAKKEDW